MDRDDVRCAPGNLLDRGGMSKEREVTGTLAIWEGRRKIRIKREEIEHQQKILSSTSPARKQSSRLKPQERKGSERDNTRWGDEPNQRKRREAGKAGDEELE